MNIQEIEKATGLPRANIRYYEKEGLLNPERGKNRYRKYSEEDRDTLLKILLLRNLGVSLAEIRELQEGKVKLPDVMGLRRRQAEKEAQGLRNVQEICAEIYSLRTSYEELNAAEYLEEWKEKMSSYAGQDCLSGERHPWYRFFARGIDLALYGVVWSALLTFYLRWYPMGGRYDLGAEVGAQIWSAVIGMVLCLFLEPLFLACLGTTPGKWIFGIRLTKEGGGSLTYREGFDRTWEVLSRGMGFQIPIYGWVKEWDHYEDYQENGFVEWDREISYTFRSKKLWQCLILYIVTGFLCGLSSMMMGRQAALPKNRGDLTIAEFAENYNGFKEYYDNHYLTWNETDAGLDSRGRWVSVYRMLGWTSNVGRKEVRYLNSEGDMLPIMTYQTAGDGSLEVIKAEAVWNSEKGEGIFNLLDIPGPIIAAFMGAQKEVTAWNGNLERILDFGRTYKVGETVSLTIGDVTAEIRIEAEEVEGGIVWPDSKETNYHWTLTMTKERRK